ncbi:hypothetical protein N7520_002070 [Penicillium odoratum]|uniref:uncharacterized protein n=1 Tax=Penicillium odoratum TaxID=1167516 RepID=UPI002548DCB6|nr:uncharacterized protein N7520_002070 [Penicillium odoratum]KAJ5771541.1 hypothetical protein N7520_002070 [Penicillium odoratum]
MRPSTSRCMVGSSGYPMAPPHDKYKTNKSTYQKAHRTDTINQRKPHLSSMDSPFTLRTDLYPPISPDKLTGSLKGKNALITGSGRGIGREVALALAAAGAKIAITARTASEVEATRAEVQELISGAGKVIGITADLLKREDQERLVQEFHDQLGPIHLLILNAGNNIFQPFHLTEADGWWDVMELNVRAPVELTRLFLPEMMRQNEGTIIYTSSRAAKADLPWTSSYNCAKTAITRFAGTLHAELEQLQPKEHNTANKIEVFSIHPGEIETQLHQTAFPQKTRNEAPYVVELLERLGRTRPHFAPQLPAWTTVWLCAGKGAGLKGQFIDCTRDVEEQQDAFVESKK